MTRIHLDYAATTPLDNEVFLSMEPYFKAVGNPSSIHSSGREAKQAIEEARGNIANYIGAAPNEIIFTGSGTESDNLALIGTARANQKHGKHIIVSAVEHKAVLEAVKYLEKEGFEISSAPVDKDGVVMLEELFYLVRKDTILISIMLGNNEVGTIEPVKEIGETLKTKRGNSPFPLLHTDACQAFGYVDVNVKKFGVDLLSFNGSKIYGPKGVGVLYKRNEIDVEPLIVGGEQELGLRAGTESLAQIIGLAKAVEITVAQRETETERLHELREYFIAELKKQIPDIIINGHTTKALPHIVHVTVPQIEGESMVLMLDEVGIETATGSACSAKDLRASHVLKAIGQNEEFIHGSVRFSLGRETVMEDITETIREFVKIVEKLRSMSALNTNTYEKD